MDTKGKETKKPLVSVVVCAFNAEKTVKECIQSILNQSFKGFELIIVNDGSTDKTKEIVEAFKEERIKLFSFKKRKGVSIARNLGIKKARGEFIAFTDSDCVVEGNWLKELMKGFGGEKTAGAGGTSLTHPLDSKKAKAIGLVLDFLSGIGSEYARKNNNISLVKHNPSCNSCYRKKVLIELNGFNEGLASNEDPELDYRIRKKGYLLKFNPNAVVFHHRRDSFAAFFKQAFWFGLGRMQAIKLHAGMIEWFRLIPLVFLIAFLAGLLFAPVFSFALLVSLLTATLVFSVYLSIKNKKKSLHHYFTAFLCWFFGYGFGMVYGLAR